jgi:hypothetical protein
MAEKQPKDRLVWKAECYFFNINNPGDSHSAFKGEVGGARASPAESQVKA